MDCDEDSRYLLSWYVRIREITVWLISMISVSVLLLWQVIFRKAASLEAKKENAQIESMEMPSIENIRKRPLRSIRSWIQ